MAYFPVVGASLGALIGLAWRISLRRLPPLPAAALVVATDALMTGGLHLDGLADTADGLCAHVPAKARLEIMAEPQVGTFAAVAVGVTLISRTAALASLKASPALLAALYCSSRSVMVIASRALPYAREEGLASAFLPAAAAAHDPENRALPDSALADSALADGALADSAGPDVALQAAVAGAGAALLLASLVAGRRGARAVVTGWISAALVLGMARRRLGGFTGDVLGAAGVVCETTGLLVAAAK
jgi:adenosylcobinamide-GDP ribazoletransferase